jgi:NAD(P)H-hydrate epimerase
MIDLALENIANYLPLIRKDRHKYERGVVLGFAGSSLFPGAAYLSTLAALKAGAGLVKSSFYAPNFAPEIIYDTSFDKVNALYFGPGIGMEVKNEERLREVCAKDLPLVIDADGLTLLSNNLSLKLREGTILTPHQGEMKRLLKGLEVTHERCQAFAKAHQVILVLKGVPTYIFSYTNESFYLHTGDPGMATAGCGDILTGIIASFLAQGVSPLEAAKLAISFHGKAGALAAKAYTSYSMIASDLFSFFPAVFRDLTNNCD